MAHPASNVGNTASASPKASVVLPEITTDSNPGCQNCEPSSFDRATLSMTDAGSAAPAEGNSNPLP
eukprot:CAMPEP_0184305784 /NCGR_PEP_ID=MMETSP1049-20130417/14968_1 /TAXON_ID=77928 /ORGANISM="Proteomonas sulcata, Strain CCMP704" /LENGTH=65 /DNA_ID=CAMNT_0026617919 /DNA_START=227 /DNA_END=424 /DNA_ORIENTATION=-